MSRGNHERPEETRGGADGEKGGREPDRSRPRPLVPRARGNQDRGDREHHAKRDDPDVTTRRYRHGPSLGGTSALGPCIGRFRDELDGAIICIPTTCIKYLG